MGPSRNSHPSPRKHGGGRSVQYMAQREARGSIRQHAAEWSDAAAHSVHSASYAGCALLRGIAICLYTQRAAGARSHGSLPTAVGSAADHYVLVGPGSEMRYLPVAEVARSFGIEDSSPLMAPLLAPEVISEVQAPERCRDDEASTGEATRDETVDLWALTPSVGELIDYVRTAASRVVLVENLNELEVSEPLTGLLQRLASACKTRSSR
ncbi:hypothetical protein AB1Y20_001258 [Prymnesium parvum]|uniref:Uncharacterized protein n=1 Tax=Prymnesium parvum TaxID=97485 RepID=A0AB34KD23_PRYPA